MIKEVVLTSFKGNYYTYQDCYLLQKLVTEKNENEIIASNIQKQEKKMQRVKQESHKDPIWAKP